MGLSLVMLISSASSHGQSTQPNPAPIFALSANGASPAQAYQGWALIFDGLVYHPNLYSTSVSVVPLLINSHTGNWTNTIQLSVVDSNGVIQNWPIHLIGSATGSLSLDATNLGKLAWVLAPSDTATITPGMYHLIGTLETTTSAGNTGWSGSAISNPLTIEIDSPPAQPTSDQQAQQFELQARYDDLLGNDTQALSDINSLLGQQPGSLEALAFQGAILERQGQIADALAAFNTALSAIYASGPPSEVPEGLLSSQGRLQSNLLSKSGTRGTPQVAIQFVDQGVQSPGVLFIDLQITNIGNDTAQDVAVKQVSIQTISGSGQAILNNVLSPRLPVLTDLLNVNASSTFRIFVTALGTVGDVSLTESGTTSDMFGTDSNFSQTQAVSLNTTGGGANLLTITPADVVLQYGQVIPDLSNVSYTGFVNGDTPSALTGVLSCTTTATQTSSPGAYPITCSGLSSPNYTITLAPGTLTISPAALIVTATDASRQYGQANPTFSVSYGGFANGDGASALSGTLACTTTAISNSSVGMYPITCSGLSSTNYEITYVPGQLSVTSASLTVTANDASRPYGQANPTFAVSYSGFLNGDSASVLSGTLACTTAATVSSPGGTYPINCSGLMSTNYAIAYVPGQLTITSASLTVAANDVSRIYGQANPTFGVGYSGFVNGDSASSLSGTLVCASPATPTSSPGTYPISCSGLTSPDYTITYAAGQLAVTAAALTITANNATRPFGQANPAFTASYSGFVNGDTASSSLSGTLVCSTTATASSPAGTYPINCSGLASSNYVIGYLPGQLTVTPPPCAQDVSASLTAKRSGFSYSPLSKRYAQTLTLTNISGAALTGPLYVVLDTLSTNASISNTSGSTVCAVPVGSPYISVNGTLNPGSTVSVVVQFADPSNAAITYALRILAGSGQP